MLTMRADEALVFTTFGFVRMITTVNSEAELVVPASVQRRAGIRQGDRLKFKASHRTITITAVPSPTYKPTKAELAAIRKGKSEIARGEFVTLRELLHDMDRRRRKGSTKAARKVSS
jgi:bifunctional DNA-binding transcriptional regulator/antitoxin component of YhaV-PrlF toxin-antitoxin module